MSEARLIDVPTSACIASVIITHNYVNGISASPYTLTESTYNWPGTAWTIDVKMPPITNRAIAADWKAFGLDLQGRYNRFLLGDPLAKVPLGVGTGTPVVDGPANTGKTMQTRGWTISTTGILKRGDYIQIGSGIAAKLHMVMVDANSDSSGEATLSIMPELKGSPADGTTIIVNNPRGLFRLSDDSWTFSEAPGGIYTFSFTAVEANE